MDTRNLHETFKLLRELIVYINTVYREAGLEALAKSAHPSIDDLLNVLDHIQNNLDPQKLNAVQAVILTKLLLTDIKSDSKDNPSYAAQFEQLITSLNTIDESENLI